MKSDLEFHLTPGATTTFLFTDIEGSTQLLRNLKEEYAFALSKHREILRSAFTKWNGHEVDTQGDAFFVAFNRASDAISAAVSAQHSIADHPWPEGGEISVRMGIHTGEPWVEEEGYVGMDVHRAARIGHVGHGGQVLVSETTAVLVRDELPEGVDLIDLGMHRLKDLKRPERICQLKIEDLPSEFPELASLEAIPPVGPWLGLESIIQKSKPQHNLPSPISTFVGREIEIADIFSCIEDQNCRLITLVGPPGAGKTRLALETARASRENYRGDIYLVEFAPEKNPSKAMERIARVLGVDASLDTDSSLIESLSLALSRQIMLILDNCEHLLVGITPTVQSLLEKTDELKILATSRQPLGLIGERIYEVKPLKLPQNGRDLKAISSCEAITLFCERARSARYDFVLNDDNLEATVNICSSLDGLPLAIELAAARTRSMSTKEIAQRLNDRFELLKGSDHVGEMKDARLKESIAWSYDLLEEEEKAVLRRLSIFHGGCRIEQAIDVCADSLDSRDRVFNNICTLVDKSLVVPKHTLDGSRRYDLLESIRLFGLSKLRDEDQLDRITKRHSEAYCRLVEEENENLIGEKAVNTHRRFDEDIDNIMIAQGYAFLSGDHELVVRVIYALWLYWAVRLNLIDEPLDHISQIINTSDDLPIDYRLRALAIGRRLANSACEYEKAEAYCITGLELASQIYDPEMLSLFLMASGYVEIRKGDSEKAKGFFTESFRLADEHSIPLLKIWSLHGKAWTVIDDKKEMRAILETALEIAKEVGSLIDVAGLTANLSDLTYRAGDLVESEMLMNEAVSIFEAIGNSGGLPIILWHLGQVNLNKGAYDEAAEIYQKAYRLAQQSGNFRNLAWALVGLTKAEIVFRDYARARELASESLELWTSKTPDGGLAYCLCIYALVERDEGHLNEAYVKVTKALEISGEYPFEASISYIRWVAGSINYRMHRYKESCDQFINCLQASDSSEYISHLLALEGMGMILCYNSAESAAVSAIAAIHTARSESGIVNSPVDQALLDEALDRAKHSLGDKRFEELWDEGSQMDLDETREMVQQAITDLQL